MINSNKEVKMSIQTITTIISVVVATIALVFSYNTKTVLDAVSIASLTTKATNAKQEISELKQELSSVKNNFNNLKIATILEAKKEAGVIVSRPLKTHSTKTKNTHSTNSQNQQNLFFV